MKWFYRMRLGQLNSLVFIAFMLSFVFISAILARVRQDFTVEELIIHPAGAIACLLVHITMGSLNIGRIILIGIAAFDSIWKLAIDLLFWQNSPGWAYERWITKKRGQRKRRK